MLRPERGSDIAVGLQHAMLGAARKRSAKESIYLCGCLILMVGLYGTNIPQLWGCPFACG
jgi:hypothetical protein